MSNALRAIAAIIKAHIADQRYTLRFQPRYKPGFSVLEQPLDLVVRRERTPTEIENDKPSHVYTIEDQGQIIRFLGSPPPVNTATMLAGFRAVLSKLNEWLSGQPCTIEMTTSPDSLVIPDSLLVSDALASIEVSLRLRLELPEQTLDVESVLLGKLLSAETLEEVLSQYHESRRQPVE